MAAHLGRLTAGLGLLAAAGGLIAVAVAPALVGRAGWPLATLVPAVAVHVLFGLRRVVDLLTGRTRRGGVWFTPTGLVHRGWGSGLGVRWDDLVSVTVPWHGDVMIEVRAGAPGWIEFPPARPGDYELPERVAASAFGVRARHEIVELARS